MEKEYNHKESVLSFMEKIRIASKQNVWEIYEAEKQIIAQTSKSTEEYNRRIAESVKRLRI